MTAQTQLIDTVAADPVVPSQTAPLPPIAEPAAADTLPAIPAPAQEGGDWKAALATLEDPNSNPLAVFVNPDLKKPLWNAAVTLAGASIIPTRFQGKPADVFLALTMAGTLRVNPMAVMQHIVIVGNRPTFESKFFIQLANERGGFQADLTFTYFGPKNSDGTFKKDSDDYGCECWAIRRDGQKVSASVTMGVAKRAGWINRDGSWWKIDADLMLRYRSAGWFVRSYCPQVTMGYLSDHEAKDEAGAVRQTAAAIPGPQPLGLVETARREEATDAELA